MCKWLLLLVLSGSLGISLPTYAQFIQQRFLPANGERGKTGPRHDYPVVQIDRKLLRLAPGARIYDTTNRTIVHAHLPSGAEVFYSKEQSGAILRLYILSAQEIAQLKQSGRR